jgi:hypothetical protein
LALNGELAWLGEPAPVSVTFTRAVAVGEPDEGGVY